MKEFLGKLKLATKLPGLLGRTYSHLAKELYYLLRNDEIPGNLEELDSPVSPTLSKFGPDNCEESSLFSFLKGKNKKIIMEKLKEVKENKISAKEFRKILVNSSPFYYLDDMKEIGLSLGTIKEILLSGKDNFFLSKEDFPFRYLKKLKEIDLSTNDIKEILMSVGFESAFYYLDDMKKIGLSPNEIKEILINKLGGVDPFKYLDKIKSLGLSPSDIKEVLLSAKGSFFAYMYHPFEYLGKMKSLGLSPSDIKEVLLLVGEDCPFKYISEMKNVGLSLLDIKEIFENALSNSNKSYIKDITDNLDSILDIGFTLDEVKKIVKERPNKLSDLINNLNNLKNIGFNVEEIKSLLLNLLKPPFIGYVDELFQNMKKLKEIGLSSNDITEILTSSISVDEGLKVLNYMDEMKEIGLNPVQRAKILSKVFPTFMLTLFGPILIIWRAVNPDKSTNVAGDIM